MPKIQKINLLKHLKYKQALLLFSLIFLTSVISLVAVSVLFQASLTKREQTITNSSEGYFDQQKILKSSLLPFKSKGGRDIYFIFYYTGSTVLGYITDKNFSKSNSIQVPLNSVNYEYLRIDNFHNNTSDPLVFLSSSSPYTETTLEVLLNDGKLISQDFMVDIAAEIGIEKSKIVSFHLGGWTDDKKFKINVFTDTGNYEVLANFSIPKVLEITKKTKSVNDLENVSFGSIFKFPQGWELEVYANGKDNKILRLLFKNAGNTISTILNPSDRGYEGSSVENIVVSEVKTKKFVFKEGSQFSEIYVGNFCNPSGLKNCYGIHFEAANDFKNNSEAVAVFNEIVSTFKFSDSE